jgi:hypothetical protein
MIPLTTFTKFRNFSGDLKVNIVCQRLIVESAKGQDTSAKLRFIVEHFR